MSSDRKQRLRTLENRIRKLAGQIQQNGLEIGRHLCAIRDEEDWREVCGSWNEYLKGRANELIGKSFAQAAALIQSAEIEKRLPENLNLDVKTEIGASHLRELGRLAPAVGRGDNQGVGKDYSKLKKTDVGRVLEKAKELAGDKPPSVRDVRKAVDIDLGIDRSAKSAATKAKHLQGPMLHDYLTQKIGYIDGVIDNLAQVPADAWELLEGSHPFLAEQLAAKCDELAALLRS